MSRLSFLTAPNSRHSLSFPYDQVDESLTSLSRDATPTIQDLPSSSRSIPSSSSIIASLRGILTSLLILTPPELHPDQLSSDLQMRHRILSLPSTAPYAPDLVENIIFSSSYSHPSVDCVSYSDEERSNLQHDFVSWLSRPPIELDIHETDIHATARSLFLKRMTVMRIAQQGDQNPIDLRDYELLCCENWHRHRRVCVRFPENASQSSRLHLMMVDENKGQEQEQGERGGGWKVDNLFSLHRTDMEDRVEGMHVWTESCEHAYVRLGTRTKEEQRGDEQGPGEAGAEYIADADDFWAGFSDEDDEQEKESARTSTSLIALSTEPPVERQESRNAAANTDQEMAIRDIIRGAYTLHRNLHPHKSDPYSIQAFLNVVHSTIAPATSTSQP
ncbi:uncharacterized protein MEPE_05816 [Melanopsichium pennsylvanicum]|uniref:Uncharacterized protein n=2 Tax=Melanopsichium pennsylvanicum TaxID=63383 RepID=A0AAJ5C7N4_9BASI|nr:hypothetical protein BN887_03054 [Melanopsichium pennsylvanicum 4]SNX87106.1 uncharacterized protein MEPE_05816 [Melanopsichium pennsylvanicum]